MKNANKFNLMKGYYAAKNKYQNSLEELTIFELKLAEESFEKIATILDNAHYAGVAQYIHDEMLLKAKYK